MSKKYDFREFTKLPATKANVINLCGKDFIDKLTAQKIFAKDELFWEEICKKLNIPDMKKQREQEEQERLENQEKERKRLLTNKKLIDKKEDKGWEVLIFELPDSEMFGKKYFAEAYKEEYKNLLDGYKNEGEIQLNNWVSSPSEAFSGISSCIYEKEKQVERLLLSIENYKLLKPIYLMFLYLSGWDEHFDSLTKEKNKENFTGVESWIGLDYGFLDFLEEEGLIQQPQKRGKNYKKVTYACMTKKGMKEVREILGSINLEGADRSLKNREYHEEYINHKSQRDLWREEKASSGIENEEESD